MEHARVALIARTEHRSGITVALHWHRTPATGAFFLFITWSSSVKFAIQLNVSAVPIDDFLTMVREAEDAGFDHIFLTDGLSTHRKHYYDVFTVLPLCARVTSRAHVGTCVTSFAIRHPVVTAQAICTVDEISGGRAALGIGAGDTPVHSLGLKVATLADIEAGLRQIRAFIDGEPFDVVGSSQQVSRLKSTWQKPNLPIYLAADGPKTLELGGRAADGIIVGAGITPEVARWAMARARSGLAEAQRDGRRFRVWLNGFVQLAATPELARAKLEDRILSRVHHNFRRSSHAVPPEHLAEVERFRDRYDDSDRTPQILAHNMALLTDYLWERFAIAGPESYCLERFQALEEAGIEHFIVAGTRESQGVAARREFIKTFGSRIIPRF